jgi:thiamine biosynthesis lipoprotein
MARQRIDDLEARWSRFRPDSEISRLNSSAGREVTVSADTCLLVHRAIEAWRLTGGGFDPTLLDALRRAGYDRTFDEVRHTERGELRPPPLDVTRPGCTDIEIRGAAITLPAGMGFDPGGIGKGLAADLVAAELLAAGAAGACVNMGGDVRVAGVSPTGAGWTVALEHPWRSAPMVLVGLWDGAVATSSVLERVWTSGGRPAHHLIDPATGLPSTSDVALASVVAGEAWTAEVLAKAILLRGASRAFDLLDDTNAALVVQHDGRVSVSAGFGAFVGTAQVPGILDFDLREDVR